MLIDMVCGMSVPVWVICGNGGYTGTSGVDEDGLKGVFVLRRGQSRFGRRLVRKMVRYAGFYAGAVCVAAEDAPEGGDHDDTAALVGRARISTAVEGVKHFVWEMDVHPDVAAALGMFAKDGVLERLVGWMADGSPRRADGVGSLGPCMRERLVRRGVPPVRVWEVDNWANGRGSRPWRFVSDGRLKVLYSGNVGLAHGVGTFPDALESLRSDASDFALECAFRFGGGGPQMRNLRAWAFGRLPNVEFSGYVDRKELGRALGWCDVGLVTQIPETVGTVVPSKTSTARTCFLRHAWHSSSCGLLFP